jgi:hypothetical protein
MFGRDVVIVVQKRMGKGNGQFIKL